MSWLSLFCFLFGSALLADCVLAMAEGRDPYYWIGLRKLFSIIFCRRR